MHGYSRLLLAAVCGLTLVFQANGQPPAKKDDARDKPKDSTSTSSSLVTRMMAFDKNKDGKLSKEEITDNRLLRLFEQADANKDGVVTEAELKALAEKEGDTGRGGPGGPGGGPGGPGGPGGGPGGPGGPGGRGGPPQPGQVLPAQLQEMLKLTADQKKQIEELQKEVDAKLGKILTDEQKKQLKEAQQRGPGGPGGRPLPPQN